MPPDVTIMPPLPERATADDGAAASTRRAEKLGRLGNRDDLDLLAPRTNNVADGFSHQRLRDRRNKRNRTGFGVGFVFSNDAIFLNPSIGTAEGDGAAKGHCIRRRWIRDQFEPYADVRRSSVRHVMALPIAGAAR